MKALRICIAVIFIGAVVAGAGGSFWLYRYATTPLAPDVASVTVTIPRGTPLVGIVDLLEVEGIVLNRRAFYALARVQNAHHSLRAGEYDLPGRYTPLELIERLRSGAVKVHAVTIPEGFSIYQIADRFAARGLVERDLFFELLHDADLLASLGIDGPSAEGYLFPDTYPVTRSKDEEAIIRFMVRRFRDAVTPAMIGEAERMGLTIHELITLASIIEKESRLKEEKPLISAVFHNRLKRGMRLQSDPTVVYGVESFEGRIRRKDLERDTPYNTYRIRGLPPGPICSPGLSSIEAALNPAPVDYLYFVSRNDGSHHFSRRLSEHNQAVIKYQIKRQK